VTTVYVLLVIAIFSPLAGACVLTFVPAERPGLMRRIALVASIVACVAMAFSDVFLAQGGDVRSFFLSAFIKIDSISMTLLSLNALLGLSAILLSGVVDKPRRYFWLAALVQLGATGVFVSSSLAAFWVSWAVVSGALCLMLGRWGGQHRAAASIRFLVAVSLIMLAMAFAFIVLSGSYVDSASGTIVHVSGTMQIWASTALLVAFGASLGLFPLHFWLPWVHEGSAAASSLLLDGTYFSMAAYGFIRIALPLAPTGFLAFQLPLAVLSALSVLYGALGATAQRDARRVNSYYGIANAGLVGLAISCGTEAGLLAALLIVIGRACASGMLITALEVVRSRLQTLEIAKITGIASVFPLMAGLLVFAGAGVSGTPLLAVFPGTVLLVVAVSASSLPPWLLIVVALGFVVLIVSIVRMLTGMCTGSPSAPVLAYTRHLSDDPFDILIAGERVPVGVEPQGPPIPESISDLFPGDLVGLVDLPLHDSIGHPTEVPIERLRTSAVPSGAAAIASRDVVEELAIFDELAGIADILPQADLDDWSVTDDDWGEAERRWTSVVEGLRLEGDEGCPLDGMFVQDVVGDRFAASDVGEQTFDNASAGGQAHAVGRSFDVSSEERVLDLADDHDAMSGVLPVGAVSSERPIDPMSGHGVAAPLQPGRAFLAAWTRNLSHLTGALGDDNALIPLVTDHGFLEPSALDTAPDSTAGDVVSPMTYVASVASRGVGLMLPLGVGALVQPPEELFEDAIPGPRGIDVSRRPVSMAACGSASDEGTYDRMLDEFSIFVALSATSTVTSEDNVSAGKVDGRGSLSKPTISGSGRHSSSRSRVHVVTPPATRTRHDAPDDPMRYETLPDHSSDPFFRYSTLSRFELALVVLLALSTLGVGIFSASIAAFLQPAVRVLLLSSGLS
jgi:NADH-quinone oxidoreductase subunit M